MGVYIIPNPKNFLALSGGTVSGDTYFSQNLSATTYFSGSTPLETTIYNIASTFALTFSAGTNLYVVSSSTYPHITYGLNDSIGVTEMSATTIYSGSTDLSLLFKPNYWKSNETQNLYSVFTTPNYIIGKFNFVAQGILNKSYNSNYAFIGNGNSHSIINSQNAIIINGLNHTIGSLYSGYESKYGFIGNGFINRTYSKYGTILNGRGNHIYKGGSFSTILNGKGNFIHINTNYSTILNGFNNFSHGEFNAIFNGKQNEIKNNSNYSIILNGCYNIINDYASHSAIIAGKNNVILQNITGSTIAAGSNMIADKNDTLYAPNLKILNSGTAQSLYAISLTGGTIYSGSTELSLLIPPQTLVQNGINTFTGGTFSRPSVNITALTINSLIVSGNSNFNTLSATTFSAGTINSGSTNLYDIFVTQGSAGESNTASNLSGGIGLFSTKAGVDLRFRSLSGGSGIGISQETNTVTITLTGNTGSNIVNGINTFTAGTPTAQSVNVTALTINTITASGSSNFNTLSATTFSAGTINSGSTNLYNIFATPGQLSTNNNGINTFTAGTSNFQSINVTGLSINNISVSGNSNFNTLSANTLSAGTINSGSTNLYDIFSTLGTSGESNTASNLSGGVGLFSTKVGVDLRFRSLSGGSGIGITQETNTVTITYTGTSSSGGNVVSGINTFTAGTATSQSVNVTALTINTITASGSSNFNTLSATTFSAGTINSGSTNLYDIFATPAQISTNNNGINTFTAGTANFQSINVTGLSINNITVSGVSSFFNLSATSLSAITFYSGSTDLSLLIPAQTLVQNGINTFTGGTSSRPTVNITALTINNIIVSGSSNFNTLSANTLSGATIYSGSTNLGSLLGEVNTASNLGGTNTYGVFVQKSGVDLQFKGFSAGTGISILTSTTVVTISANDIDSYLNLSGGTVTGVTIFNSGLSANTLSGGTIYSGSTPLQNIFVVSGQNLSTLGTSVFVNKTGSDLNFRTLSGSSGTSLSISNNVVTITSPNIPSGAYLFIPSSGYRSIVQANGSNVALGRFSFAVGNTNTVNGNYSVVLNGKKNTVNSIYGASIGGINNADFSSSNGLILTSSGTSIDDSSISYNTIIGSKNIKIFANKSGLESQYTLVANSKSSNLYQNNFGIILGSNIAQIGYLNVSKPKTQYSNIINSTNSKIYSNFSSILNSKNSFIVDKRSSGSSIISSYATSQAFIRYSRRSSLAFSKESYIDASYYFKDNSYNSHIIGSDNSITYNSQNSLILVSRSSSVGYKTSLKQFFAGTLIAVDGVINKSEKFGFAINSKTATIDFKAKYSGLINSININLYDSIGTDSRNLVAINSSNSIIDGGIFNTIIGTNNSYIKPYLTEQSSYSIVLGGNYNKIVGGVNSFIVGGYKNNIVLPIYSGIIGGLNNELSSGLIGSAIIGGKNITLNQNYTVAVPELRVSVLPIGSGSIVVTDTNGYLKKSSLSVSNLVYSVLPGTNTFTAGTANNPTINVTALTINTLVASGSSRFVTLSATTLSAGTIYSANTNLDQIFHLKSGYLLQKNGLVSGSTFAGSPLTASVTFTSSFSNNNYIIIITGEDARMWSISSKSTAGFTINSNSSVAISGNVFWMASENGEGYR